MAVSWFELNTADHRILSERISPCLQPWKTLSSNWLSTRRKRWLESDRWQRRAAAGAWRPPGGELLAQAPAFPGDPAPGPGEYSQPAVSASPQGDLHLLQLKFGQQEHGLEYSLDFALPEGKPLLLWRLRVENKGQAPLRIDRLDLFKGGRLDLAGGDPAPSPGSLPSSPMAGSPGATAASMAAQERQRRTRLGFSRSRPTPTRKRPAPSGRGISPAICSPCSASAAAALPCWLASSPSASTSARWRPGRTSPVLVCGCGRTATRRAWMRRRDQFTDWACLALVQPDARRPPWRLPGGRCPRAQRAAQPRPSPTGWCSWYHFFQKIDPACDPQQLAVAAAHTADLPLDLVQIDDGFEAQVGDWLAFQPAFPQGVAPLAAEIRDAGFTPDSGWRPLSSIRDPGWLQSIQTGCCAAPSTAP